MGVCAPWTDSFINNQNNYQNIDNKTKMIFFENISLNNCLGLTQFPFVTLGTTLTYTTPNLNNSRNLVESNKCIDRTSCNHKDRHPCHGLPQENGIIK